jgi:hypothetical protein
VLCSKRCVETIPFLRANNVWVSNLQLQGFPAGQGAETRSGLLERERHFRGMQDAPRYTLAATAIAAATPKHFLLARRCCWCHVEDAFVIS